MKASTSLALAAVAATCFTAIAATSEAQVSVSIGLAPSCPYGYYDTTPYGCSPSGYYGPEWFSRGAFIGAGPWFRGDDHFQGHVNNRFHPEHGYTGPMPQRGDRAAAMRAHGHAKFEGNELRDGRGHARGEEKR